MADLVLTTGSWTIDPTHTVIGFSARHAMVAKVRGRFEVFSGGFVLDGADPSASSAQLSVEMASVDTKNADRDAHLKSAEFFDVEQFPTMTFTSTSIEGTAPTFTVHGDLSVHGVTKNIPVRFELVGTSTDPWGGTSHWRPAESWSATSSRSNSTSKPSRTPDQPIAQVVVNQPDLRQRDALVGRMRQ
jgi:polyisoprenoid-binding protein YceI